MTLIISDDNRGNLSLAFEKAISNMGAKAYLFSANTLNIKPCAACGSCSGKTYGRCVIQDDMQKLYPKIAGCSALVLVSPVVFGGVSYHIKKLMDRMAAVGNPRYYVNNGELVKGMMGQGMNYYMVGIGDKLSEEEKSAFLYLHKENINIMSTKGKAFILDNILNQALVDKIVQEIING